MNRRLRRLLVAPSVLGLLWMLATPAVAHPLGNFTTNSFSAIEVATEDVTIHYVVDMAEIPTFQLKEREDVGGDAGLQDHAEAYATTLLEGLDLVANGEALDLSLIEAGGAFRPGQGGLDVTRFEFEYRAPLPQEGADISYVDRNFIDKIGWREIIAYPAGDQGLVSSSVPAASVSDELRTYPKDLLSDPLEVTSAALEVEPGAGTLAPGADPEGSALGVPSELGGGFAELIEGELTPIVIAGAILLAVAFGALHAIGPGHGKTIMAAYLVGAGGKARQAVAVGIAVSLMHTTSVVVLGLITLGASSLFAPEEVFPWLSFASGLIVLGLGVWLLQSRVRARRAATHAHDHAHDHDHGHSHEHEVGDVHSHGGSTHSHSPPPGVNALSWKGLGAIAVSGGLLPSPTALVVLLGAVALDRVAFGVALVAAFSVGLAAALTLVGILVLRARDFAFRRLGSRVGGALPLFSAAAILMVGLFLTTQAALNLPF